MEYANNGETCGKGEHEHESRDLLRDAEWQRKGWLAPTDCKLSHAFGLEEIAEERTALVFVPAKMHVTDA